MSNMSQSLHFNVKGMTCNGCVEAVKRLVKRVDAQADVSVDLASGKVEAMTTASPDSVIAAVSKGGYEIHQV